MCRDIPDWKDMPDGVPLGTLLWEDVYIKACEEMGRNPTRDETLDMFEEMANSMSMLTQDDIPAQLDALISEIVIECLKSKPYNSYSMTDEELTFKKYCYECKEIQETYWELNHCEKNPEGIDVLTKGIDILTAEQHGNDGTCEDGYCNPESTEVEKQGITVSYIKDHAVYERCVQCHQYFDSAGPQEDDLEKNSKVIFKVRACKKHYSHGNAQGDIFTEHQTECDYCKVDPDSEKIEL